MAKRDVCYFAIFICMNAEYSLVIKAAGLTLWIENRTKALLVYARLLSESYSRILKANLS